MPNFKQPHQHREKGKVEYITNPVVVIGQLLLLPQGCDASVLIASPNGDAEKDSPDNISLAGDGFDTVNKAKEAVEAQCPGVVSCADILALAARDVVALVRKHHSIELNNSQNKNCM